MRLGLLVMLLLLVAACEQPAEEVDIGEADDGMLVIGRAEVDEVLTRGVGVGDRTLVLDGFRGRIQLQGTLAETASLEFTKRARGRNDEEARQRLADVHVEEEGGDEAFTYRLRSEHTAQSAVDVSGELPQATRLRILLESGAVTLSGIRGPLEVDTQNGNVQIGGASQSVRVEVRNGSIDVGLLRLPQQADIELRTQNGNLSLTLPGTASARIEARTQAGDVRVDGLQFTNRQLSPEGAGARFIGQLGTGQASVQMQTENGSVLLREGSVERIAPGADTLQREMDLFPETDETPEDTLRAPDPPDTNTVPPADTGAVQSIR